MNTKDYLLQFKGVEDEIECLDYFSESEFIQSVYDTEMNDEQRKELVKIFNHVDDKVRRMKALKMLAAQQIEDLDHDVHSELLYLRYVEGKNFADVAEELFLSVRYCYDVAEPIKEPIKEESEIDAWFNRNK